MECGGVSQLHPDFLRIFPKGRACGTNHLPPPETFQNHHIPGPKRKAGISHSLISFICLCGVRISLCLYKVPSNFLTTCPLLPALCPCTIPGTLVAQGTDPGEKQSHFCLAVVSSRISSFKQLTMGFPGSWRENSGVPCTESTPSAALNPVYLASSMWKFHQTPENLIPPCPCHLTHLRHLCCSQCCLTVCYKTLNCVKGVKKPQEHWRIIQIQGITQVTSKSVP